MCIRDRYWQVGLHQEYMEKTAFLAPSCLFQFKVIPFGPVSYTHLDVYKRQVYTSVSVIFPPRSLRASQTLCITKCLIRVVKSYKLYASYNFKLRKKDFRVI